jgi:hypothetical protein
VKGKGIGNGVIDAHKGRLKNSQGAKKKKKKKVTFSLRVASRSRASAASRARSFHALAKLDTPSASVSTTSARAAVAAGRTIDIASGLSGFSPTMITSLDFENERSRDGREPADRDRRRRSCGMRFYISFVLFFFKKKKKKNEA